MSARRGTDELEVIRQKAMMDEVVRKAGTRTESRELALERENASLREQLRLANERAEAAEIGAAHLQKRLEVAHASISFANDKMAERERQARYDVAAEVLEDVERFKDLDDVLEFLGKVRIANAPKDGPTIDDEPRHNAGIMAPRNEDGNTY